MFNHFLCLGHNGDVKSTRIRSNGINSSATGTLLSDKHKLGTNNYKYYSDLSEISGGILGTIPEKVSICIMASFDRINSTSKSVNAIQWKLFATLSNWHIKFNQVSMFQI